MLLRNFVAQLNSQSPQLSETLTVAEFVRFISLAAEALHIAGESLRLSSTRFTLIPFLATALSPEYPHDLYSELWCISFPILLACRINPYATIREFGLQADLTTKLPKRFLRAPMSQCFVCSTLQSHNLHIHSRINRYLYDIDGVHAIETVILCCSNSHCGTFYRPSYYIQDGLRHYYTKEMGRDQDYLHIHCHYYMTQRLAYMFRIIQMLAHVSHFNLVNWYNHIFVDDCSIATFTPGQGFTPSMSEETCPDGLILHSLMNHADRRGSFLAVTSSGTDSIRFDSAIESHLNQLEIEGTRYRDHYCSSCVRLTSGGVDPETGKELYKSIRAVVTDGLTIGHWRCSASSQQLQEIARSLGQPPPEGPCTTKLANINDRYCPDHFPILGGRCRAQPCPKAACKDSQTCDNIAHIEAWAKFNQRIQGNFSLTSILNRPGSHLNIDPTVHMNSSLQHADESQRAHEGARDGGESQAAGKYLLSRSCTHNDQLIVACCGIILARKTFYNAESVSAVKVFLEESFPRGIPEVVFYNNACRLTEHIYTGNTDCTRFLGTVIPVDPFHHRSHAESDEFCRLFTDPRLFPDIQEDGSWIFNASAGELSNIWYGGFASMCRNMHPLVYNLFLEEMVYFRNAWLTKKLDKRPGMEFLGEGAL